MHATTVLNLYNHLANEGIHIWVDGGWCVDALLRRQTRLHNDLDIVIEEQDVRKFRRLLEQRGYIETKLDTARPHNFVLVDQSSNEIDVHVIVRDEHGNGIYGPIENGEMYPADGLRGEGEINDRFVRCISAECMVRFLAPWLHKHPDKYLDAIAMLCDRFGIPLPEEYKNVIEKLP